MNRLVLGAVALVMCASFAFAQPGPGGPGGPPGMGGHVPGGPGGGPGGGPPGMPSGFGPGGGPGRGRGPEMNKMEQLQTYLEVVQGFSQLSRDADATSVAAVIAMGDVLRHRGPEKSIEYFHQLLPQVKSESVRRAIQLQLADLYKVSGQQDRALDELQLLITGYRPTRPATQPE